MTTLIFISVHKQISTKLHCKIVHASKSTEFFKIFSKSQHINYVNYLFRKIFSSNYRHTIVIRISIILEKEMVTMGYNIHPPSSILSHQLSKCSMFLRMCGVQTSLYSLQITL